MNKNQFTPVPFTHVTIADNFWAPRLRVNRKHTLATQYQQCQTTGRFDALRLTWKPGQPNEPHIFWDSDVAKWIEAAAYSLATHPDPALAKQLDAVVDLVISAQQPDGYLNSYFTVVAPGKRWTNLRDNHELYCAGHLIEAAVAHFQTTGQTKLLAALCRYVDYIATVFGPGKKRGYCGHEEIELALVKLYRVTQERRYLRLAQYFIDERGRQPHYFNAETRARGEAPAKDWARIYAYHQAHEPVRRQTRVTGHSVRAMYLYSAMADLAGESNDAKLRHAGERLWEHLTKQNLYVTGGIGSSRHNEGFTIDYDLPNEGAYAETCAAIGLVFWAHRLLQLDCDGRYADVMERALYNGILSGISLDGRKFFYENPLASTGQHHRQAWFGCACCPPNIARLFASLGQYVYSQAEQELVVHLYAAGTARLQLADQPVTVCQQTNYPWDGKVKLTVNPARPAKFAIRLRIPGWCRNAQVRVNGRPVTTRSVCGYLRLVRIWKAGDQVDLTLAMPVEKIYANPRVRQDCGRVALQRGPVVYCFEQVDNGADLNALTLPAHAKFTHRWQPNRLGGVVTLHGQAKRETAGKELYSSTQSKRRTVPVTAVPYYAWDNRAPGEMLVWIRMIGVTS